MNYTPIINAVIALVGAVITVVLIPYIKTKISSEKLKRIATVIEYAVKAAEQLYKGQGKMGDLKKAHVLSYLVEKGYIKDIVNISTEIDNLIERSVYELKK
jgi:F0F1-type ATP synthase membrane subunit a